MAVDYTPLIGGVVFNDWYRTMTYSEIDERVSPAAADTSEALIKKIPAYSYILDPEMLFEDAVTLTTAVRVGFGTTADPDWLLLSGTTLSANTKTRPAQFRTGHNLLYSNQAASTAITSTGATFDTKYSMPANSLKPGDIVRVRFQGIATVTTGSETIAINVVFGGTTIASAAAVDGTNNDIFTGDVDIIVRSVGASGTFVAGGQTSVVGATAVAAVSAMFKASTAVDTTAAFDVGVAVVNSSTGESERLDLITIELIRPGATFVTSETSLVVTPVSAAGVAAGSFTAATNIVTRARILTVKQFEDAS